MNFQKFVAAFLISAAITGTACAPAGDDELAFDPTTELDDGPALDEGELDDGTEPVRSAEPLPSTEPEESPAVESPAPEGSPAPEESPAPEGEPIEPGNAPDAPAGYARLGWNLDFVYAGGFVFADKMKMSRNWVSCSENTWDDGRALKLDADGWPTALEPGQQAVTLAYVHGGGKYVVTWAGAGRVDVREHLGVVSQAKNRVVVDSAADTRLELRITSLPVRDLQVRRVGQPASQLWDPIFLQRLAGAKVVRFMQWGMTNGDSDGVAETWGERSKPNYYTQNQRYGVAYEHMIALSNQLRADAWINVPHLADDDYVQRFATMLKDGLGKRQKVYVEWSNEVWNDAYPQARYARERGAAAGLGNGDAHLARLQYQSRRTRQVFEIFERVFANERDRLVRVVASQTGNDWNDAQLMGFEGLSNHADALAIAPYFGHGVGKERSAQSVRSGGVDWVLDELEQVALPGLIDEIRISAESARRWGVPLIAYEGGQHVVAEPAIHNDTSVTSVLEAAQRSPRMYALYTRLLDAWEAAGGGVFVHYTYTGSWGKWGYWGALEKNDSPTSGNGAHKYRAIMDWAKAAR